MTEQWRPIPGFPYSISSNGLVRRDRAATNTTAGRILMPAVVNGYRQVRLHNGASVVQRKVHALVIEAFVGPRPEGHSVNHRDGNKLNNSIANLEYLTAAGNSAHATQMGLMKPRIGPDNGMYGRRSSGFGGRRHTPATRKRMSEAAKGNQYRSGTPLSAEHKAKLRAGHQAWVAENRRQ